MNGALLVTPCCCNDPLPDTCSEAFVACGQRTSYAVAMTFQYQFVEVASGIVHGFGNASMALQGTVTGNAFGYSGTCNGTANWSTEYTSFTGLPIISSGSVSGTGPLALNCNGFGCSSFSGTPGFQWAAIGQFIDTLYGTSFGMTINKVSLLSSCAHGPWGGLPNCRGRARVNSFGYGAVAYQTVQGFDGIPDVTLPFNQDGETGPTNTYVRTGVPAFGGTYLVAGPQTFTISVS